MWQIAERGKNIIFQGGEYSMVFVFGLVLLVIVFQSDNVTGKYPVVALNADVTLYFQCNTELLIVLLS